MSAALGRPAREPNVPRLFEDLRRCLDHGARATPPRLNSSRILVRRRPPLSAGLTTALQTGRWCCHSSRSSGGSPGSCRSLSGGPSGVWSARRGASRAALVGLAAASLDVCSVRRASSAHLSPARASSSRSARSRVPIVVRKSGLASSQPAGRAGALHPGSARAPQRRRSRRLGAARPRRAAPASASMTSRSCASTRPGRIFAARGGGRPRRRRVSSPGAFGAVTSKRSAGDRPRRRTPGSCAWPRPGRGRDDRSGRYAA